MTLFHNLSSKWEQAATDFCAIVSLERSAAGQARTAAQLTATFDTARARLERDTFEYLKAKNWHPGPQVPLAEAPIARLLTKVDEQGLAPHLRVAAIASLHPHMAPATRAAYITEMFSQQAAILAQEFPGPDTYRVGLIKSQAHAIVLGRAADAMSLLAALMRSTRGAFAGEHAATCAVLQAVGESFKNPELPLAELSLSLARQLPADRQPVRSIIGKCQSIAAAWAKQGLEPLCRLATQWQELHPHAEALPQNAEFFARFWSDPTAEPERVKALLQARDGLKTFTWAAGNVPALLRDWRPLVTVCARAFHAARSDTVSAVAGEQEKRWAYARFCFAASAPSELPDAPHHLAACAAGVEDGWPTWGAPDRPRRAMSVGGIEVVIPPALSAGACVALLVQLQRLIRTHSGPYLVAGSAPGELLLDVGIMLAEATRTRGDIESRDMLALLCEALQHASDEAFANAFAWVWRTITQPQTRAALLTPAPDGASRNWPFVVQDLGSAYEARLASIALRRDLLGLSRMKAEGLVAYLEALVRSDLAGPCATELRQWENASHVQRMAADIGEAAKCPGSDALVRALRACKNALRPASWPRAGGFFIEPRVVLDASALMSKESSADKELFPYRKRLFLYLLDACRSSSGSMTEEVTGTIFRGVTNAQAQDICAVLLSQEAPRDWQQTEALLQIVSECRVPGGQGQHAPHVRATLAPLLRPLELLYRDFRKFSHAHDAGLHLQLAELQAFDKQHALLPADLPLPIEMQAWRDCAYDLLTLRIFGRMCKELSGDNGLLPEALLACLHLLGRARAVSVHIRMPRGEVRQVAYLTPTGAQLALTGQVFLRGQLAGLPRTQLQAVCVATPTSSLWVAAADLHAGLQELLALPNCLAQIFADHFTRYTVLPLREPMRQRHRLFWQLSSAAPLDASSLSDWLRLLKMTPVAALDALERALDVPEAGDGRPKAAALAAFFEGFVRHNDEEPLLHDWAASLLSRTFAVELTTTHSLESLNPQTGEVWRQPMLQPQTGSTHEASVLRGQASPPDLVTHALTASCVAGGIQHWPALAADFARCGLTGLPLVDPVFNEDGSVFERSSLQAWQQLHAARSPFSAAVPAAEQAPQHALLATSVQRRAPCTPPRPPQLLQEARAQLALDAEALLQHAAALQERLQGQPQRLGSSPLSPAHIDHAEALQGLYYSALQRARAGARPEVRATEKAFDAVHQRVHLALPLGNIPAVVRKAYGLSRGRALHVWIQLSAQQPEPHFLLSQDSGASEVALKLNDVSALFGPVSAAAVPFPRLQPVADNRAIFKLTLSLARALRQASVNAAPSEALLNTIYDHLQKGLKELNRGCLVCAEQLAHAPIRPTTCGQARCDTFFLAAPGDLVLQELRHDVKTADLLLNLAHAATQDDRAEQMLPDRPIIAMDGLRRVLDAIPNVSDLSTAHSLESRLGQVHRQATAAATWVLGKHRGYLTACPPTLRIAGAATPHQFLLANVDAARETRFADQVRAHRGVRHFALHAGPFSRWHAILREGLRSEATLITHGRAHGDGVYLSPEISTARLYLAPRVAPVCAHSPRSQAFLSGRGCIAVCEVAGEPRRVPSAEGQTIWVVEEEARVMIRFLLVYEEGAEVPMVLDQQTLADAWQAAQVSLGAR